MHSLKEKIVVVLILAAFSSLILASARPPALLEQDRSGNESDLQELEALFSENTSEVSIRQILLGGPAREEIYAPPYADFFRNSTFGSFLNLASGRRMPHMNYSSLDQSIDQASLQSKKSHLQPILIDGPDF